MGNKGRGGSRETGFYPLMSGLLREHSGPASTPPPPIFLLETKIRKQLIPGPELALLCPDANIFSSTVTNNNNNNNKMAKNVPVYEQMSLNNPFIGHK